MPESVNTDTAALWRLLRVPAIEIRLAKVSYSQRLFHSFSMTDYESCRYTREEKLCGGAVIIEAYAEVRYSFFSYYL